MRLLLAGDWPAVEGGTERYLELLAGELRRAGDETALLTGSAGSRAGGTARHVAWTPGGVAAQAVLQVANPFAGRTLRRALAEEEPDGVVVTTFLTHLSPSILPPLAARPSVVLAVDYRPVCPIAFKLLPDGSLCTHRAGAVCVRSGCIGRLHRLRDRPRYRSLRAGLRAVGRVLACSAWLRDRLVEDGIAAEAIDLPVAAPAPGFVRKPAPAPRFVYLGRLSREKGVDVLLEAFARLRADLPGATLRIAGDGPDRGGLEQRAAELQLGASTRFLGQLAPAAACGELEGAWALVAPSRWAEPLGLAAIEAIVHGVPVVAARAGGFLETVEEGSSGLFFERGDADSLARRLRTVGERRAFPTLEVEGGARARARARHDPSLHVRRLRAILVELGAGRPRLGGRGESPGAGTVGRL